MTGSITIRVSYVGETEKRNEFMVVLEDAKGLRATEGLILVFFDMVNGSNYRHCHLVRNRFSFCCFTFISGSKCDRNEAVERS